MTVLNRKTVHARETGHTISMLVGRIAWSVTTAMFVITAVALFASGYDGYGGVFLAVAVAAAVNLLPLGRTERE